MSTQGPLMTDVNRYRYGVVRPVKTTAIDAAVTILKGDLIYKDLTDSNKYKSSQTILAIGGAGPGTLAAAQELFHDTFLGVADQRSRLTEDTAEIVAHTSGVFEMECAAATFAMGALVGIAVDPAATTNIDRQRVIGVATANLAVGRVVQDYAANTDTVLIEIMSTLTSGGPQAAA